ncbi:hypothetical protein [Streptomyces sp. NPDC001536]|uniref:hypothetical protein n=1 Tax=Streptomyces sp. NPDC001536 TaxID=3364583 RepID=UPI0036A2BF52
MVDDHPESNRQHADRLESPGGQVVFAEDARQAELVLDGPTRGDPLISDVARGMDGDARFTALERWRANGRALGAEITMSSSELYQYTDSVPARPPSARSRQVP